MRYGPASGKAGGSSRPGLDVHWKLLRHARVRSRALHHVQISFNTTGYRMSRHLYALRTCDVHTSHMDADTVRNSGETQAAAQRFRQQRRPHGRASCSPVVDRTRCRQRADPRFHQMLTLMRMRRRKELRQGALPALPRILRSCPRPPHGRSAVQGTSTHQPGATELNPAACSAAWIRRGSARLRPSDHSTTSA